MTAFTDDRDELLERVDLGPSDRGMVALALEYARRIDAAEDREGGGVAGPEPVGGAAGAGWLAW